MFKRLMAILALGAFLAACSPASDGSSPAASEVAPVESPAASESASPSP
jgi:nitrous oxide reductase accessory protein NosL